MFKTDVQTYSMIEINILILQTSALAFNELASLL